MLPVRSQLPIPVTQRRNANSYDWETRHKEVIQYNKRNSPKLVFIGNSITHNWGDFRLLKQPMVLIHGKNILRKTSR
jgi:hypothetical protein